MTTLSKEEAVRQTRWEDFVLFSRAQIASGDIDPMYPVLKRFYAAEKLSPEVALWRTLLYVTWYHVGSAETVWRRFPEPTVLDPAVVISFPTGIERRGFRGVVGGALARKFVAGVLKRANFNLLQWVLASGTGEDGWKRIRREFESVAWAGPWASYKWADLLRNVHDIAIEASDIGVGGRGETAGPIPGMVALTGKDWKQCANDVELQKSLLADARARGVGFGGLDQLETCLCDFNSLIKGHYYVGADVDMQMTHLQSSSPGLWEARAAFPDKYRGELGQPTWFGVRKHLLKHYALTGEVTNT